MKKIISYFSFLFLAVAVFLTSWPLLRPGMFAIHDFVHGARIVEMAAGISQGQIPVRWSANFGYGYGMPLFEFYAPLPYYVGAFFYLLGLPLVTSVKLLFLLTSLGTVIGGYFLGKSVFESRWAGILVAYAVAFAPYRALNLFIRGAVSEAWGMMALPWIMYGFFAVKTSSKKGFLAILFGCLVLFLSHNLTTLIALPFLMLFFVLMIVVEILKKTRTQVIIEMSIYGFGAVLLAIGLSAFYLFPAFLEKGYTQMSGAILDDYFNYSLHFLYIRQFFDFEWAYGGSEWGPDDKLSFFLGFGQLFGLIITGVMLLQKKIQFSRKFLKKPEKASVQVFLQKYLLFFSLLVFFFASLFMTLQRSYSLWQHIPLLQYVQFPWRFLSVASFFLAMLAGVPFFLLKKRVAKMIYFFSILGLLVTLNTLYFKPERHLDDAAGLYYEEPARIQKDMSGILPDFIPSKFDPENSQVPPVSTLICETECRTITPLVERAHERLYAIEADRDVTISFAISDFPGWVVEIDGEEVSHSVSTTGTIDVALTQGIHMVGIQLQSTPIRLASDWATAVSIVVTLSILIVFSESKRVEHFRKKSWPK